MGDAWLLGQPTRTQEGPGDRGLHDHGRGAGQRGDPADIVEDDVLGCDDALRRLPGEGDHNRCEGRPPPPGRQAVRQRPKF